MHHAYIDRNRTWDNLQRRPFAECIWGKFDPRSRADSVHNGRQGPDEEPRGSDGGGYDGDVGRPDSFVGPDDSDISKIAKNVKVKSL